MVEIGPFRLSDADGLELVSALCKNFAYETLLGDGSSNTETKPQFARRMIREWLESQVLLYRRKLAEEAVNQTRPEIT